MLRNHCIYCTFSHKRATELAGRLPRLANFNVAVREWNEQIVFLHKIVEGGTDRSYGIHVARLAGVPKELLDRAKSLLASLEAEAGGNTRYTAGALRFAHAGADDVATLVDLSAEELDLCDFGEYTEEQFTDDMLRNPPLTSFLHRPPPRCCLTARPCAVLRAGRLHPASAPPTCTPSSGDRAFRKTTRQR